MWQRNKRANKKRIRMSATSGEYVGADGYTWQEAAAR